MNRCIQYDVMELHRKIGIINDVMELHRKIGRFLQIPCRNECSEASRTVSSFVLLNTHLIERPYHLLIDLRLQGPERFCVVNSFVCAALELPH